MIIYQLFVQSLAIFAVILFILSFHTKSRRSILFTQIISLAIWAIHFFLLSAWTGAILMVINGIITIMFLFKEKSYKLSSPIFLYLSLLILVIFTALTWERFYSLFPLLGVSLITIAKWQDNPNRIRTISFFASSFWIFYDLFVGAWGSVIAEILIMGSILISLLFRKKIN